MANTITVKSVQVHQECSCGYNIVEQDHFKIKWKDLRASGIIRKAKGLFVYMKLNRCESCEPDLN